MTETTQTTAPVETEQTTEKPNLQLSDLVLALQTIQAVSQRGAIRADEMTVVGGLHDRLFAFLEAQGAITKQQQPDAPANTTGE